ncbi:MAG: zinc protease, partial [Pirellulaceae bacterium]
MQLSPLNAITSLIALLAFASAAFADGYTIVVSKKTLADPQWSKVVETLKERHRGEVISYESLDDTLSDLQKQFPRHTCFVATRDEATRQFVANVHRLTRKFDDDPYTDTLWGIL